LRILDIEYLEKKIWYKGVTMRAVLLAMVVLFSSAFATEDVIPWKGKKLQFHTIEYDKNQTGFIRHLKLYKYPAWVSKITLRNGKELYFSSPKSMFEFYFLPAKWPDLGIKEEKDFKLLLVTDYNTLKPINAKGAFYVYGSKVISPAGDDLPAFASYDEAQKFADKYNGKRVLSFDKVNRALINLLNGRI